MVETTLAAAATQTVRLPGEATAATLISRLARDLLDRDRRIKATDKLIAERFRTHPQAPILESLPGIGPHLGAEFVIAVGDLSTFRDSGHLAAYAGLAPVPRDSGRVTGNLHRPRCYHRPLRRVFYLSALSSLKTTGPNRAFYDRKRAEGRRHHQALMALARRRVDVIWALLRDGRQFTATPPTPAAALDTLIEIPSRRAKLSVSARPTYTLRTVPVRSYADRCKFGDATRGRPVLCWQPRFIALRMGVDG
jgi:hypothetical protein